MTNKLSNEAKEVWLVERGWMEKNGSWKHPTLNFDWPLEDAFRLQRGSERGARGPLFEDLRNWLRAKEATR